MVFSAWSARSTRPTVRARSGERPKVTRPTPANLAKADLVVIVTDHSDYDFDMVVRNSRLVLDTRNATRSVRVGRSKVHKL